MVPKTLNKQSTKIFKQIISKLNGSEHIKINNSDAFMSLSVEKLQTVRGDFDTKLSLVSLAHYGEQNGDLIADPDVVFLVIEKGKFCAVYPVEITQAFIGEYKRYIDLDENLHFKTFYPAGQRDLKDFCNIWMKNIKYQQLS